MKVNARFGREGATGSMTLTREDIIDTMAVLVALRNGQDTVDSLMPTAWPAPAWSTASTTSTTWATVVSAVSANSPKTSSARPRAR